MDYSIDQNTDYSSRELYTYLSGVDIPDFVKEAELSSVFVGTDSTFADSMGRKFPINSKSNVYISNAFLQSKKAEIIDVKGKLYVERVEAEINKAAELLNITDTLNSFNKIAHDRSVMDIEAHDIILKLGEEDVLIFGIKTAAQLVDSANEFSVNLKNFPFEWRRGISEQFVKAAEALNIEDLPDIILKYAGQYYPDVVHIRENLKHRATKLGQEDKENYLKLAEAVNEVDSKEEIFKIAEICYNTEKRAGIYENKYTSKIIKDPVDSFFTLHVTKVAEILDTVTMGGEKFAMADLRTVPSTVYEQAFGFDLDIKSAEARDVLPTMPKEDVGLFMELSGIRPLYKSAIVDDALFLAADTIRHVALDKHETPADKKKRLEAVKKGLKHTKNKT